MAVRQLVEGQGGTERRLAGLAVWVEVRVSTLPVVKRVSKVHLQDPPGEVICLTLLACQLLASVSASA